MERGKYLAPFRSKKTRVKFQGETTYYVTNFTPPTAKPGDTLYVDFPRIKDELVVPGSFALTFNFEVILDPAEPENEVNTYPVNNLAANIISDISIKIGSQPIFELDCAYLYNTYKDFPYGFEIGEVKTAKSNNGVFKEAIISLPYNPNQLLEVIVLIDY